MKQKSMVLIVLAVVCGLGAMFMTSKLLADRQGQEDMVKVLVARRTLDTATIIKKPEDMLEEKEIPKDSAPKNALTKFEEAKGRQLKIPRRAGDIVTQDDLHDTNGNTMMQLLPKGYRAVGIRVSSEMIAAGFAAVPHSRVDIACMVRGQKGDKDNGARIILQNVLVLASGQETIRGESGKAMMCEVVTVALTPDDALNLEAARAHGALSMYLRPFGESTIVESGTHTFDTAIGKRNGGSSGREEADEAPKKITVPELNVSTQPQVKFADRGVNTEHMQVIRNKDEVEKYKYVPNEDGTGYDTQKVEVNSTSAPAVSSTSAPPSGARTAPRPGTTTTPGTAGTPPGALATPQSAVATPPADQKHKVIGVPVRERRTG